MMDAVAPGSSAPAAATPLFEVADITPAKKKWFLGLHPAHLTLHESPEAQPYVLVRQSFPKEFNYVPTLRALVVNRPVKTSLKLTTEAGEAFTAWIGKGTLAAMFLKRRYGFILPLALIWMITSLPLPGNPGTGLAAKPFDGIAFALGGFLMGAWAWARWRPHPALFLVDAIWFGCLAARMAVQVQAGATRFLYIFVALGIWMMITGGQHFWQFRGVKIPRAKGW
jgi:hypothetical protein